MGRSLEKLLVMIVLTFVDLQGFIVERKFVVKKVAVPRKGSVLSHYIFANPYHGIYLQNPTSLALPG